MSKFFTKIFDKDIFAILIIGAVLFGLVKYIEIRFNLIEKEFAVNVTNKNELENKIKNLEEIVSGTKSNLTSVLQQEQEKNNLLAQHFSEVTNTVSALEKLSSTDPELLKKYSKVYFLNEHYIPISLSEIGTDFRSTKSTSFEIHSDVLPYLESLVSDTNALEMSLRVQSAYRSFAKQTDLKATYKITYGAGANRFSADQGYSEHQLGTTVDFTSTKLNGSLTGFEKTPEYKWLKENGYKYGFVISYPEGNKFYKFEPWHWRFVGVALATRLHDDGVNFYDTDQRVIDSYLAKIFE